MTGGGGAKNDLSYYYASALSLLVEIILRFWAVAHEGLHANVAIYHTWIHDYYTIGLEPVSLLLDDTDLYLRGVMYFRFWAIHIAENEIELKFRISVQNNAQLIHNKMGMHFTVLPEKLCTSPSWNI